MSAASLDALPLSPWAARLGYAGLLPFVSLAAAAWLAPVTYRAHAAFALLAYGATIASFLGAIHWGLALRGPLAPRPGPLVWGVFPSLVAWLALLLLVICLVVDRGSYPIYGLSQWLPMRWHLTGVAVVSLMAGSVAL